MSPKIQVNLSKIDFSIFLHVRRRSIRSEPCFFDNDVFNYYSLVEKGALLPDPISIWFTLECLLFAVYHLIMLPEFTYSYVHPQI